MPSPTVTSLTARRWQRRRLEILQRSDFSCESCEATDRTLHVHHKIYRKGAMPWEYADVELEALCADCHARQHRTKERLEKAIAELDEGSLEELLGYADALIAKSVTFDGRPEEQYPNREWQLTSWEHARGFYVGLYGSAVSKHVYDLIDLSPLNCSMIFGLRGGEEEI